MGAGKAAQRFVGGSVPAPGWKVRRDHPGCPQAGPLASHRLAAPKQVAWLHGRGARGETSPPLREAGFPWRSPGMPLTTISRSGDDQGLALCSSSPSTPSPMASLKLRGDWSLVLQM